MKKILVNSDYQTELRIFISQIQSNYTQRKNILIRMMNSNNLLIQLINGALRNQNNDYRRDSQAQLLSIRTTNPNQFFIQCAQLVNAKNQQDFIRQSASTLLVGSVRAKINNNVNLWDALMQETRIKVKSEMLNSLVDTNLVIVKSGANVISHIAAIQIPRNQWLDIVDTLAENTTYNDINVRKASIITIGNICQQFHQVAVTIDPRTCAQFLGGIIVGTKQTGDASIVEASMKALRNSLSFLKPIMSEQTYRNQVFKILYDKIYNKNENDDRSPYEALFQFCKSCYQYLGPYLDLLVNKTIEHIQQRNDNTILALQLLDTVGTQYIERIQQAEGRTNNSNIEIKNYLTPIQSTLLPEIMRCLLIMNKDDLDFPQMRNSAAKTLSTFANLGDRQTVDIIANGTATCLKSQQLGHQQASAILLSTLCENSDKDYVVQLITQAFQPVLCLLNSKTQIVILNTLNGLITIAEFYPYIFYNHENIREIINKLFELVDPKKSNVTTAALIILKNITDNIENNSVILTDPSILLTRIVSFYEQFLDNFQGNCKDYSQKAVLTIMNCLIKIHNRQVVLQMLDFLMGKYYYFYEKQVIDQDLRLISLSSVIHTCILALENTIPKDGLINNLCTLIDKHIEKFRVQQQGLNMISAMAVSFNKAFQARSQKYWPILEAGLNSTTQPRTFKIALCSIGDYSRVYAQTYINKELQILNRLLVLMHENYDRAIKLNIIACIADLLLGLGLTAEPYIGKILDMINLCFQAVYELSNNSNERDYVEELKRSLIDMYACLTFSINSKVQKSRSQALMNHFPILATFVVKTCDRTQNPTIDYLKSCLYTIFDSATFFWRVSDLHRNTVRNILDSQQIKKLVKILDNFKSRNDIAELISLIQQRYMTH